eukprot:TRINITY_DN11114_c0_g1_i1.p1 TRINITY_DN11114_c0_g1~~TRINITY_DN11114_c0_g1_i1.p1  ORF type:complete len:1570 (-),score=324.89 TRINITY_DN11114_c0_g1_i1:43-4230(-)
MGELHVTFTITPFSKTPQPIGNLPPRATSPPQKSPEVKPHPPELVSVLPPTDEPVPLSEVTKRASSSLLPRPPTAEKQYTRNRNTLVESFFVVTNDNLAVELQDRFEHGEKIDNLFAVKFTGSVVFQYPEMHPDDFSPLVWMFCFPQRLTLVRDKPPEPSVFSFMLTSVDGTRKFVSCLTFYKMLTDSTAKILLTSTNTEFVDDNGTPRCSIYEPVCFCVNSQFPFYSFYREWLCTVYDSVIAHPQSVPLESYITLLVNTIPAPTAGGPPLLLTCSGMTSDALLCLPRINDLPRLNLPLITLFRLLSVNEVLTLVHCLLLEEKVLICGRRVSTLFAACECLAALLWPLQWAHVLIPLLPESLREFLSSPTPFLVGMISESRAGVPQHVLQELVVVDLDAGTVTLPTAVDVQPQQPAMPAGEATVAAPLPEREVSILQAELNQLLKPDVVNCDSVSYRTTANYAPPANVDLLLQLTFCKFIISLLREYQRFLVYVRVMGKPVTTFDKLSFANSRPDCLVFMERLVETQAFSMFVEAHDTPVPNFIDDWISLCSGVASTTTSPDQAINGSSSGSVCTVNRHSITSTSTSSSTSSTTSSSSTSPRLTVTNVADSCQRWCHIPLRKIVSLVEAQRAKEESCDRSHIDITPSADGDACSISYLDFPRQVLQRLLLPPQVLTSLPPPLWYSNYLSASVTLSDAGIVLSPSCMLSRKFSRFHASAMHAVFLLFHPSLSPETDEAEIGAVVDGLQHKQCREIVAQCLLDSKNHTDPPGKLASDRFMLLATVLNAALHAASTQREFHSPLLLLDVCCSYFHVRDGAEEFLFNKVRNHDIWQNSLFWDQCFLKRNHEALCRQYNNNIREQLQLQLDNDKADAATNVEMELILNIIHDCVFAMANLGVSASTMHRFVHRTCTLACLDEERTKIAKALTATMAKVEVEDEDALAPLETELNAIGFSRSHTNKRMPQRKSLTLPSVTSLSPISSTEINSVEWVLSLSSLQTTEAKPWLHSPKPKSKTLRPSTNRVKCESKFCKDMFVVKEMQGHTQPVLCVTHNSTIGVTGSCDQTLRVWELRNGNCVGSLLQHTGWVNCVEIDPACNRIISGSYDKSVNVWDAVKLQHVRSLLGHKAQISCLRSLQSSHIVSGSHDSTIALWDCRTHSRRSALTFTGHRGPVTCIFCFEDDSDTIISGGRDHTVRVWCARTGTERLRFEGHTDWVKCLAGGGKRRLLSGGLDGVVCAWDLEEQRQQQPLHTWLCHEGAATDLLYDAEADVAYSAGADSTVTAWRPHLHGEQQDEEPVIMQGHTGEVSQLSFFREGFFISGGADGNLVVWRKPKQLQTVVEAVASQTPTPPKTKPSNITQVLVGHTNHITAMQTFENKVISCGWDNSVRLWELSTDLS